ncbi:MAG TPA: Hsp20/alpha crystallin family protein [Chitinophagaceae bacterium]|nr:Hsp20/alpha crystallin family protein [Chitinophagaceae bacterium]
MLLVNTNYPVKRTFDSLFNDFFNTPATMLETGNGNRAYPKVNIHETEDAYHLELLAAGRNKEDFNVTAENGLLTIGYEKKEESKTEDYKTIRKEFTFSSFKRSFSIDENIDAENIQAKYENGVLKLYLPKKKVAKETPRHINIQ